MPSRPRKGIDDNYSNGMVSCRMNWSLKNDIDVPGPTREWAGVGKCGFSSSSYISCNPASSSVAMGELMMNVNTLVARSGCPVRVDQGSYTKEEEFMKQRQQSSRTRTGG
ncbi:hypothetical protein ACH5RR_024233 [Cinchona calisaya]|uniref:Uncharacterized protein n=1 Tax=Cinchona calisaya TaxID=153742 RepID=A0ABD2ZER0_9GENT